MLDIFNEWIEFDKKIYREGGHIIPVISATLIFLLNRVGERGSKYLEIGSRHGSTAAPMAMCAKQCNAELVLVDQFFQETNNVLDEIGIPITRYEKTSDHFFLTLPPEEKYDFIHIDGGHQEETVRRDVINSLKHLAPTGIICMDDFMAPAWFEVTEGFFRGVIESGERLCLIIGGPTKAFFCRPSALPLYYGEKGSDYFILDSLNSVLTSAALPYRLTMLQNHTWLNYHAPISIEHAP